MHDIFGLIYNYLAVYILHVIINVICVILLHSCNVPFQSHITASFMYFPGFESSWWQWGQMIGTSLS